ncbi:hypothetical protein [Bradyrhizobium elkanii]|uniref:hypothetical protein n=1 Tax=Bradyrhizobium elkanii TaxID=29448 RepID=UPI0012BD4238|nr:hypothetical protein [Bradyrhizobium elkanii]
MRFSPALIAFALIPSQSFAQSPLKDGHYVMPPHDLFVSGGGTNITVNFRFRPDRRCPNTLDNALDYVLPAGYAGTPINYVAGRCNSKFDCDGITYRCSSPTPKEHPNPTTFRQPPAANLVNVQSSWVSGDFAFTTPVMPVSTKRAPMGKFEIVEQSPDKKQWTVRLIGPLRARR